MELTNELQFRATRLNDIEELFDLRAQTRENALSREALAALGITPSSIAAELRSGRAKGWVCTHRSRIVGFTMGDAHTGEVLVLAVLPNHEGKGIGRELLCRVVDELCRAGCKRLWLQASALPTVRSHGFYRALGWRPTGERTANGDEILQLEREM